MAGDARVVVLGDVIDDVVVIPEGPRRDDTDTLARIRRTEGGSAANTAAWLGSLGTAVDFVGRTGAADAARHGAALAALGVTPHIQEDPLEPTGSIVILVEGHQRTMFNQPGANWAIGPDAVGDELLAGAAALYLTGYSLLGGRILQAAPLIARARAAGALVVIDPASSGFLDDLGASAFLAAITGTDVLLPSLDEGRVLTGLDEPEAIAAALTAWVPEVVLTCGAQGAVVAVAGTAPERVAAVPPLGGAVDPTGAGDAFAAGFLAARTAGESTADSARIGAALASRAVAQPGGRPPRD